MNTVLKTIQKLKIPCQVSHDFMPRLNDRNEYSMTRTEEFFDELKMVKMLALDLKRTFLSFTLFEDDPEFETVIPSLLEKQLQSIFKIRANIEHSWFLNDVALYMVGTFLYMKHIIVKYLPEREEYDLSQFCLECADFWADFHKRLCDGI